MIIIVEMEIKKTKAADLEGKRLTGFLLGMIAVLAIFFVALEYNESGSLMDDDDIDLDDFARNIEMIPITRQKNENIVAMEKPKTKVLKKHESTSEKIKVVEDETVVKQPDAVNVMEGDQKGEAVTEPVEEQTAEKPNEDFAADQTSLSTNPHNLRVVEDLPQYPGGAVEFMKWLTKTLRYPLQAQNAKIEGKVVVQFIVNTDGTITDMKLVKPVNTYLDREALRVMRMMPKWKPGMQDGKPCRTMVCIPIVFHL